MNILIDIGHPAHVHLFKHFAFEMQRRGNVILFTCREKEFEIELLKYYGFNYKSFGKKYNSKPGKLWGMIEFSIKEFISGLNFKPDILLSHGSMYAALASKLLNKPHIALEDSGNWEQIRLYLPFTKCVLTPFVLHENLGKKQIRYNGYHELAYLHPNYFTPDKSVLKELGINGDEKYAILRFVSWNASHDIGQTGMGYDFKKELINLLSKSMKVFISSEQSLPAEFSKYSIPIPPQKMHDALSFASIFIGEGATMAAEAGILGTPSIYINSISRSYCEDQEKYGLVYNFKNINGVIDKVKSLLPSLDQKKDFTKRNKMLADKIDVTAFLVWFVENYPESIRVMKENPEYQERFK